MIQLPLKNWIHQFWEPGFQNMSLWETVHVQTIIRDSSECWLNEYMNICLSYLLHCLVTIIPLKIKLDREKAGAS